MKIKGNKTSVPRLCLSGQPSKEVSDEDSICREPRLSIFLSTVVTFGQESHLPGPFFSALRALGPQRNRSRRWTLEHVIYIEQANHSPMCLVTRVMDEQTRTDRQVGPFYRRRWGQEVFHRSFKQTLPQHKMRSGSPGEAKRERDWALMAYLMLGLWSVAARIEAHQDPLTWSVAESLRVVRGAMRQRGRFCRRGGLVTQGRRAVKDGYVRTGSKSARPGPRKKNDHPPGLPKMREATEKEKHRAQKTYEITGAA